MKSLTTVLWLLASPLFAGQTFVNATGQALVLTPKGVQAEGGRLRLTLHPAPRAERQVLRAWEEDVAVAPVPREYRDLEDVEDDVFVIPAGGGFTVEDVRDEASAQGAVQLQLEVESVKPDGSRESEVLTYVRTWNPEAPGVERLGFGPEGDRTGSESLGVQVNKAKTPGGADRLVPAPSRRCVIL